MIRSALDGVRAATLHARACYALAALAAVVPLSLVVLGWTRGGLGPLEALLSLLLPTPWVVAVAFWALGRIATDVARRADAADRLAAAEPAPPATP